MAQVVLLSRTSQWGLGKDAALVEQILRECNAGGKLRIASVDHMDPIAFTNPKPVDIQIHLEVPCRLAWPWAKINIVVVNPEWWPISAWNWALETADWVIFKTPHARTLFPEVEDTRAVVIPWRFPATATTAATSAAKAKSPNCEGQRDGTSRAELRSATLRSLASRETSLKEQKVLYLVGASVNKQAAAATVVAAWDPTWPTLEVWGTAESLTPLKDLAKTPNIVWKEGFQTEAVKVAAQEQARFHAVASVAEGFGYPAAEAANAGALPLWTDLDAYQDMFGGCLGSVGCIRTEADPTQGLYRLAPRTFTAEAVREAMTSLLNVSDAEAAQIQKRMKERAAERLSAWREGWRNLLGFRVRMRCKKKDYPLRLRRLPKEDLPRVAILTLTRNRPKWFTNMSKNILGQDYPTDKLTWVIVDDGDSMSRVDQDVLRFQQKVPHIRVEYVSLTRPWAIGAKRNRACEAAIAAAPDTEVFVMMDDDDHYPRSSVEARVTYMRFLGLPCVYSARIQMYDCCRYISAMNVPPLDLAPAQRVSEATLAFTRAFWEMRAFPSKVSVAEGEGFLAGREAQTAEIPPEGVIVSFIHGGNSTSRRVPADQAANGCHYGFEDEYFLYLCERGEDLAPSMVLPTGL